MLISSLHISRASGCITPYASLKGRTGDIRFSCSCSFAGAPGLPLTSQRLAFTIGVTRISRSRCRCPNADALLALAAWAGRALGTGGDGAFGGMTFTRLGRNLAFGSESHDIRIAGPHKMPPYGMQMTALRSLPLSADSAWRGMTRSLCFAGSKGGLSAFLPQSRGFRNCQTGSLPAGGACRNITMAVSMLFRRHDLGLVWPLLVGGVGLAWPNRRGSGRPLASSDSAAGASTSRLALRLGGHAGGRDTLRRRQLAAGTLSADR